MHDLLKSIARVSARGWILIAVSTILPPCSNCEELAQNSLTVAAGQHVLIDFANLSKNGLSLTGNVDNSGTIYVYSTNSAVSNGSISAANIFNNQTGLITSNIPTSIITANNLQQSALAPSFNLNLVAANMINNAGQILTSGTFALQALTLTNSGSVIAQNLNIVANMLNNTGILSAINNTNLNVASIVNSGTIAAQRVLFSYISMPKLPGRRRFASGQYPMLKPCACPPAAPNWLLVFFKF